MIACGQPGYGLHYEGGGSVSPNHFNFDIMPMCVAWKEFTSKGPRLSQSNECSKAFVSGDRLMSRLAIYGPLVV